MNKKILNNRPNIILIITILIIGCIGFYGIHKVKAETIKQHEEQIAANNVKIEQIEQIKNQLHITASLVREEKDIDNGLSDTLSQKWHEYNNHKIKLQEDNQVLTNKIESLRWSIKLKKEQEKKEQAKKQQTVQATAKTAGNLIGYFTITHYCNCSKCCGKWAGGKTASGTTPTAGRTIAVDKRVIPMRSKVVINGHTYTAEDTGSAIKGNKIDIYVSSHSEALSKGKLTNVPVYAAN